jgi:hypothetical protein
MSSKAEEFAATSLHTRYELTLSRSWRTEPMDVTLRLTNPGERDALRAFLEKRECRVEVLGEDLLRVGLPHELHDQQARLEVDLYLRVWESLHESRVEVVS